MSDEEIMKQFQEAMREEELKKEAPGNVAPYKATRNLNTQIGNPSVDLNNTMDVNIQNNNESFSQQTSPKVNDVKPFSVNPMDSNMETTIPNNNFDINSSSNISNSISEVNNDVNTNIDSNNNIDLNTSFINKNEPIIENSEPIVTPMKVNNIDNNGDEYSASSNLNVAISSPELNMDNAMDLNIENNSMNIDMVDGNEEYVPEEENNYYPGNTSNRVFISDTARRKKKKTIKINSETKTMLIIVIFLFAFITFLPRIYDFFRLIRSHLVG